MSTPYVLLGFLAERPRHGYDLKHAYDSRFPKAKPMAFGQIDNRLFFGMPPGTHARR